MKKASIIVAALLLSACSLKKPTLEEKFLKRFEGYNTLSDPSGTSPLKIEQGGKRLDSSSPSFSFTFIKANSETTGIYVDLDGQVDQLEFIFTAKESFTLNGKAGFLKK